jgi:glycosyltransferase involved in cell wall biosynthesis
MKSNCTAIIAAYNNFLSLQKVLWGYEAQTRLDFDVIVADDGSNSEFSDQLSDFAATSSLRITHLWHPDAGFRKCAILNRAIRASEADYLIFTDADMVPRNDFVANHLRLAHPCRYLAGGTGKHCELPQTIHEALTDEEVKSQLIFDLQWLRQHGVTSVLVASRVALRGVAARVCDALASRRDVLVGGNTSVFLSDVLNAQGFDETFEYGGEDRDLGIRLANLNVRGELHKYSLCCMHLAHARPYRNEKIVAAQRRRLVQRKWKRIVLPSKGIEETPQIDEMYEAPEECVIARE